MYFLQSISGEPLQVTPYTPYVYGFLVLVLIVAISRLWVKYNNRGEKIVNVAQKAVGAIDLVETTVDGFSAKLSEIYTSFKLRNEKLSTLISKVEDLEDKIEDLEESVE